MEHNRNRQEKGLVRVGASAVTRRGREKADALADAMLDCLLDRDGVPYSTVISGGGDEERTAAVMDLLSRCADGKLPVFLLHAGNRRLRRVFAGQPGGVYLPADRSFSAFDLFGGMKPDMIADILYETGQRVSDCGIQMFKALRLGLELINKAGESCSLQNLCTFPWEDMGGYIREHQKQLNALEAMNRLGGLDNGAAEADVFFSRLKNEPLPITDGRRPVMGLRDCLSRGAVVCLDILSDSNRMLAETLLATLNRLRARGYRFLTVVDALPLYPNSLLLDFLGNRDRRTPTVYSSPDCTAVRGMGETERHSMLGGPLNLILFSHMNGNSAETLSQLFSEHDDVNMTVTEGTSRESLALIRKTVSKSSAAAEVRRRNIMPEEFRSLPRGVALVFPAGADRAYMPIQFGDAEQS